MAVDSLTLSLDENKDFSADNSFFGQFAEPKGVFEPLISSKLTCIEYNIARFYFIGYNLDVQSHSVDSAGQTMDFYAHTANALMSSLS